MNARVLNRRQSESFRVGEKALRVASISGLLALWLGATGYGQAAPSSPNAAVEFSDQPTFSVAGVTDWTAAGGHGSDATLRTSEDLTRATISLRAPGDTGHTALQGSSAYATREAELRAALSASPRNYAVNRQLGEFYLNSAHFLQAVTPLETASEISKAKAADEFNLALACRGLGDFEHARTHVTRALAQEESAQSHRLAGELNEKLGDPVAALQQDEIAVKLAPTEENYFALGSELLLHRAIPQAEKTFARGANIHSESARLKTGWGSALFAGGHYEEAAQHLCEASDLDPSQTEPYLFLGQIALASPSPSPCVEQKLSSFVHQRPNNADANYFYAMFLLKQGVAAHPQTATDLLRKVVAIDPGYAAAYLELGILAFSERRFSDAVDLYTKADKANPEQAETHYRLGLAYARLGKSEQSQQEFRARDAMVKSLAEKVERQRREIKQFVFSPQPDPPAS